MALQPAPRNVTRAVFGLAFVITGCGDDSQSHHVNIDLPDTTQNEVAVETEVAAEIGEETTCAPVDCTALGAECGTPDNGCGTPLACGTCSRDHATGTCGDDYMCGFECDAGFHACGDLCADNTDITHCGPNCDVCTAPTSLLEVAVCDGTCKVACSAQATDCNGVCTDLATDKDHCGACDAAACDGRCVDKQCIPDYTVTLVSGDSQSATLNNLVPALATVKVVDASGANAGNVTLYIVPSAGASANQLTLTTASTGIATFKPRVGRAAGNYDFAVGLVASGAGGVTVHATATVPDADTVFPLVNVDHGNGNTVVPGAGSTALVPALRGFALAHDGTLYFISGHRVLSLAPSGAVNLVAGTGASGNDGDQGPAKDASLSGPNDLVLDEPNGLLYIADTANNRVRVVDLTTHVISNWAGGGTASDANFGDDGPAAGAVLLAPQTLSLAPDGALFIFDRLHNRVRRVDPATTIITTAYKIGPNGCAAGDPVRMTSYASEVPMAWDAAGQLYLGGSLGCGDSGGGNGAMPGVVRIDAAGVTHRVAGLATGTTSDGATANALSLKAVTGLAFDPGGNLYISEGDRVRRVDVGTGLVSTVIGGAAAGGTGDFGAATTALVSDPGELVFAPSGELIVADRANRSLRSIWAYSRTAASTATLAITAGDPQTVSLDAAFQPLTVKLSDASNKGVAGALVTFTSAEDGAYLAGHVVSTGASGVAAMSGRVGLSEGAYVVTAEAHNLHGDHVTGSPKTFTITAEAPDAGTIFTAVNVDHVTGNPTEGPGSTSRLVNIQFVTTGSDGTAYFTAGHSVFALDPDGVLERIAGTSASGFGGDFGDAVDAAFSSPKGLALDEVDNILYVADTSNHRIRAIDRTTGIVTTFAGGGAAAGPGFGDDAAATDAVFQSPVQLALYGRDLYIGDEGHTRIRKVALDTGIISNFLSATGPAPNCGALGTVVALGSYSQTYAMTFDKDGRLYLGITIACGDSGAVGSTQLMGILRRNTDGTLIRIAGKFGGSTADGAPAAQSLIEAVWGLALDGDRLYLATGDVVKAIDLVGGTIKTVVGTGAAGAATDYVAATTSPLSNPHGLAIAPGGHLLIADTAHFALRWVWAPLP